jgi:thymidylate synthase ThyX
MSAIRARIPAALGKDARKVYEQALLQAWQAYAELGERLYPVCLKRMTPFGRVKGLDAKAVEREATKKAIELARYVLPLAAHTVLHHSIGLLDLARYHKMMGMGECSAEAAQVVGQMKALVQAQEPELVGHLFGQALDPAKAPEAAALALAGPGLGNAFGPGDAFAREYDSAFGGPEAFSALVDASPQAEALVAQAVREVLGLSQGRLSDADALACLLDPSRNALLLESMNCWAQSPLMRCLNHAQYTFRKRISHTADSQDQRHRAVPASRPMLCHTHTSEVDAVTPPLIAADPLALEAYQKACAAAWQAKNQLIQMGVPAQDAVLLLPNAVNLRFTQSGSLMGLLHKWRMRTCFLAQEEIYQASMQELAQVALRHPQLAAHVGPPCATRKNLVPSDGKRGPCPEGDRWCGISVWLNFPKVKRVF